MDGAVVAAVESGSIAEQLGLQAGDRIIRINGGPFNDLIEFQFEWAGENVLLEIEKKNGDIEYYEIEKDYDEQLGAIFQQAVFDGLKQCRNRCLFCFVDQMPAGMRPGLYVKDDDYRLSFLQGSYITMTNLDDNDLARIVREHLSPLYVSVHTTVPDLRNKMLGNPQAGMIIETLRSLSREGIEFHTQVVLCPGLNDGQSLEQTYRDLSSIEGVKSMALVPVGLTRYREGLPEIKGYDQESSGRLIDWAEAKQVECKKRLGTAFVWPSDEFFLTAGRALPDAGYYEDYPQLENGIGMVRLFWEEFGGLKLPGKLNPPARFTLVTGVSGEYALRPVVERLNRIEGLTVDLKTLPNRFFGPTVTVTGLLTGSCLLDGLAGIDPGSRVVIPDVMLRAHEGEFLDDLTVSELVEKLKVNVITVPAKAKGLVDMLFMKMGR
ncbi:MAG: DUF512 domain-containing protein [Peptococcaceae bacterium]|jgi:putative radical SAM enzyme (TIGR03279 family)|nr:DUF512 domain-containing protein [Peptococcaceae bacterium]MDH7525236.1 DUF512 domain-containing protein [Peptococcaceae bacterium]